MALGWTKIEGLSVVAADTTLSAAGTNWASTVGTVINAGSGERYQNLRLQITVQFPAGADGDAILHIRYSSDDGITNDTPDVNTYAKTIAFQDNATVIVSHPVPGSFDYMDVALENNGTVGITSWTVIASGEKITGMS